LAISLNLTQQHSALYCGIQKSAIRSSLASCDNRPFTFSFRKNAASLFFTISKIGRNLDRARLRHRLEACLVSTRFTAG
jgi:hypothetical protein